MSQAGPEATIYVILGSHACRTGMLMLDHKGIPYRTVTLPTGFHPLLVRARGFKGSSVPFRRIDDRPHRMLGISDRLGTVPALLVDGRRVQTNREISRFLDALRPSPPLFPAGREERRVVEEAERWGDEVLQMAARRLVLAAAMTDPGRLVNQAGAGRLGPLLWRHDAMRLVGAGLIARVFAAGRRGEAEVLAALPEMLERVDGWVEAGTLNGNQLNAADFMIAPSLALLTYRKDLRPQLERRPAADLIDRLLPEPSARRRTPVPA